MSANARQLIRDADAPVFMGELPGVSAVNIHHEHLSVAVLILVGVRDH